MAVAKPIQIETNTSAEITLTTPRKQGITIEVNGGGGGGGEPYPGPYEVTPTRETQVLRTAQKVAQRNIVVNPMPAGSATTPRVTIPALPTFSYRIDDEGFFLRANVNASQDITPSVIPGYVEEGTPGAVSAYGVASWRLPTQEAVTITPSEESQTVGGSLRVMTGEITVNPIPNDWGHITWDGSVLTVS